MNKKESNKSTISLQKTKIPVTKQQDKDRFLSYKFEILDDENIYSISFDGKLAEEEIKEMLSAIQKCLYENAADAIQKYLEQNKLIYCGFVFTRKPLEHTMAMEFAELLLVSGTCDSLDRHIGNTDIFYVIADHQKWTTENCCQGCYFAAKKTISESENLYRYNIIGQAFNYNQTTDYESGCFAIRENRDSKELFNVDTSSGETILPAFGCVDMIGLLSNIDSIQTIGQAKKIAIKQQ